MVFMLMVGIPAGGGDTAASGAAVAETAENLVEPTALPDAVVGALVMAVATSLPELETSIAAARDGALTSP